MWQGRFRCLVEFPAFDLDENLEPVEAAGVPLIILRGMVSFGAIPCTWMSWNMRI